MAKDKELIAKENKLELSTGVSRADVPAMLQKVEAAIAGIKKDMNDTPKTQGKDLAGFGKIEEITSVTKLVRAHASIKQREKAYKESAKEMGVDHNRYPYEENGIGANTWLKDIGDQVIRTVNKTELDKLEKVKDKLRGHLDEDMKLAQDLADIKSILTM